MKLVVTLFLIALFTCEEHKLINLKCENRELLIRKSKVEISKDNEVLLNKDFDKIWFAERSDWIVIEKGENYILFDCCNIDEGFEWSKSLFAINSFYVSGERVFFPVEDNANYELYEIERELDRFLVVDIVIDSSMIELEIYE